MGSSPMFPNITRINSVAHFVNQFKIATAKKSLCYDVHVAARSKSLLLLFYDLNLIRRFVKLKGSNYRVYPSYSRYRYRVRSLKTYVRSSHYLTLSLDVLRKVDINLPYSYLILENSLGIMTHKDAIRQRLGGRLIIRIN